MHCFDARRFTQAYVDGEFDARDKGEFDAHVRDCSDCRSTARFEGWFREGLRQCVPQPPLPADLRERILVQIGLDQRVGKRAFLALSSRPVHRRNQQQRGKPQRDHD